MKPDENKPAYSIRTCETFEEYLACIDMQRVVWQFSDLDITPTRSFVITRRSGGMTIGAFDESDRLLGFAHALAAFDAEQQAFYYSHMLAVDPGLQNAGIGAKLKLAQRDHALARDVTLVGWTFDPLQSRNAYLNLVKLGAVVRRYYPNYYGNASTSVLHQGLDTDRLFVEWWVRSEHVSQTLLGKYRTDTPVAMIEVPREIDEIKQRDMAEAQRWQREVRDAFQRHLAAGLYCAAFRPGPGGDHGQYLFFKDEHAEGTLNYD
ncbi:MAG: GNAT family N-acetyltransferase [Acidobacteriota bacterium]